MDDWKDKIDAWAAGKQRSDNLVFPPGTDATSSARQRRRWGQEHTLAAHQRRFRCHVCHKPSDGPRTYSAVRLAWISRPADDEGPHKGVEYEQHVEWESPTGLARCSRCRAWSCAEHLYKSICASCAGKLRPSS